MGHVFVCCNSTDGPKVPEIALFSTRYVSRCFWYCWAILLSYNFTEDQGMDSRKLDATTYLASSLRMGNNVVIVFAEWFVNKELRRKVERAARRNKPNQLTQHHEINGRCRRFYFHDVAPSNYLEELRLERLYWYQQGISTKLTRVPVPPEEVA